MVAGKCASRASRISSAQRVRSALFFSVSGGTGKVFQPSVLEYEKSVFMLAADGADPDPMKREAISAIFHRARHRARKC